MSNFFKCNSCTGLVDANKEQWYYSGACGCRATVCVRCGDKVKRDGFVYVRKMKHITKRIFKKAIFRATLKKYKKHPRCRTCGTEFDMLDELSGPLSLFDIVTEMEKPFNPEECVVEDEDYGCCMSGGYVEPECHIGFRK